MRDRHGNKIENGDKVILVSDVPQRLVGVRAEHIGSGIVKVRPEDNGSFGTRGTLRTVKPHQILKDGAKGSEWY